MAANQYNCEMQCLKSYFYADFAEKGAKTQKNLNNAKPNWFRHQIRGLNGMTNHAEKFWRKLEEIDNQVKAGTITVADVEIKIRAFREELQKHKKQIGPGDLAMLGQEATTIEQRAPIIEAERRKPKGGGGGGGLGSRLFQIFRRR